jgi:hypothetical protein
MCSPAITALRMERQHLTRKATKADYDALYRDMQPGQNVYWNGFGDPPSLTYRADFDDMEYNRKRQADRILVKGRFAGGNLGWIVAEDMELFACLYRKPLTKPSPRHLALLEIIEREGPLTIQQMKAETGMLVKEITPALHRLQEAFLVYEDQNEGQDDRGWYGFAEMFPAVDFARYSKQNALKILLSRFAYRLVWFTPDMARAFFKLPAKDIQSALEEMLAENTLIQSEGGYVLSSDVELLKSKTNVPKSVYAMHRNDILVKCEEAFLKEKYTHPYPDTLYYLLIDGQWRGAVVGKFRYTPEVEDVLLDVSDAEAMARKDEILAAISMLCGENNPIKRYKGEEIT